MEQIVITRQDGTTYPLAPKREAVGIKEARQSWGLLGDDVVRITLESPHPQHYEIGDYFSVFGRTYKLNQLPKVRKGGVYKYSYDLTFEGVQYDLIRAIYDVTIETTGSTLQDVQGDALTGDLSRFATVLIANANRVFPGKWQLGQCPDTQEDKTLTFGDGDNCLAVYQHLCQEFGVEADIDQRDGVFIINFRERVGTTHPFVFEFGRGKGLYSLERQNADSSNVVTRLKVYGSSSNISHKYRANRLCLPGKSKGQSFIEEAEVVERYGIHEARKVFDDIKPTFNGKVTALIEGSVLQFRDDAMPFDLNEREADGKTTKYLISGVSAKVHFNTGNLAGYEFELSKYDHASRTFTLRKLTDDRGDVFPNAAASAFQFAVGDKYMLLDITMPEVLITEAEQRLQERAEEYYRQNSQPKVKYALSVTKSYLQKLFGRDAVGSLFAPGDYIKVLDEGIGVDKAVRIQSLQRNLLDVYDYTLTLADVAEHNITTRVISELVELDKITTFNHLKDPARARANWRSAQEVLGMVFDPEGDYYTDKIKPGSIDTLALSVGAKSMQFALQDVVFEPNYQGLKNAVRVSAGTLTHYTIEERPRMWVIAQIIADLDDDASAYYIFARCSREGSDASIVFSKTPIQTEQDASVYHFWIGVINSVDSFLQARSLALSYGFSMINGRFIKTGRIESGDGSTYFDLDAGEIGGNIKVRSSGKSKDLDEVLSGLTNSIAQYDRSVASLTGAQSALVGKQQQLEGSQASLSSVQKELQRNLESLRQEQGDDYLRRVLQEAKSGESSLLGGLILAKTIGAKDNSGKLRSYLSGNSHHALVAGISDDGKTHDVEINHDGSARLGLLSLHKQTNRVGKQESVAIFERESSYTPGQTKELFRIGGSITPVGKLKASPADVKPEMVINEDGVSFVYGNWSCFQIIGMPAVDRDAPFLRIRGRVDMPGLLGAGVLDATRGGCTMMDIYGDYIGRAQRAGGGTGHYVVKHTIGHTYYTVQVTNEQVVNGVVYIPVVCNRTASQFEVKLVDLKGDNVDGKVHVAIFGNNFPG